MFLYGPWLTLVLIRVVTGVLIRFFVNTYDDESRVTGVLIRSLVSTCDDRVTGVLIRSLVSTCDD